MGAAKPYEVWHYNVVHEYPQPVHVPGTQEYRATLATKKDVDMKFVDTCSCGEFKLE